MQARGADWVADVQKRVNTAELIDLQLLGYLAGQLTTLDLDAFCGIELALREASAVLHMMTLEALADVPGLSHVCATPTSYYVDALIHLGCRAAQSAQTAELTGALGEGQVRGPVAEAVLGGDVVAGMGGLLDCRGRDLGAVDGIGKESDADGGLDGVVDDGVDVVVDGALAAFVDPLAAGLGAGAGGRGAFGEAVGRGARLG